MLEARSISKAFSGNSVVSELSLSIEPGQVVGLAGPSGSGKTTLLRILALLDAPDRGEVALDDQVFRADPDNFYSDSFWLKSNPYRSRVTIAFQQLFLWPNLTLRQNIEAVGGNANGIFQLAERLGVAEVLDRFPNQASLGQKQRIALLRAFSTGADFYLLDEVVSALDESATHRVAETIESAREEGKGFLLVSHDRTFLRKVSDKIYDIPHGEVRS